MSIDKNIALRGLIKIAAIYIPPEKYKRMATGRHANDPVLKAYDDILGDTRTGDQLFDDIIKERQAERQARSAPSRYSAEYEKIMSDYETAKATRQKALEQRNRERLAYANRQGPRNYVTRPAPSPANRQYATRPAPSPYKAAPKAGRAVAATASPVATAAKAVPKARRAVNPAWTTFSGGMPGKRLTLPQNDPNLRTMQGGTPGRRIG